MRYNLERAAQPAEQCRRTVSIVDTHCVIILYRRHGSRDETNWDVAR